MKMLGEAPLRPHNRARGTFVKVDRIVQPAPAPRFSRTPSKKPASLEPPGASTLTALTDWRFPEADYVLF